MISVEILAGIEDTLRRTAERRDFVLADYFDLAAGTSTGAIIAACVATGCRSRRFANSTRPAAGTCSIRLSC
jgi:patatin-like phospholipase/acyl hydrolase